MTIEQQRQVNEILDNFLKNPSNRNKYRYHLFAFIDEIKESA